MTDIEIPQIKNRGKRYRLFEILPGFLSWSILLLPFVVSFFNPLLTVLLIIAYLLMWFFKAVAMNIRVLQGWSILQKHQKYNWPQLLSELDAGEVEDAAAKRPKWHYESLLRQQVQPAKIAPKEVMHAVIVATYNEGLEVLEPTIESVLASNTDMQRVIFVLAYEERGGPEVEAQAKRLVSENKAKFRHAMSVKHPDGLPGEVIGKGPNITFAGYELQKYLEQENIDPSKVVVTTLDADNRPHPNYFAALTYTYCVSPDPIRTSYQPIPLYTQNIWDAPAPMRVLATGNSFWGVISSLRPHILRNFSAHAQSMQTLIDTDFWSTRTIVEDGHQFWRTYFRYDGQHEVYPIYLPIYQDAVFAGTFRKTLKAQFVQLRRWAWGCSDVAYVAEKGFFTKNKIKKLNVAAKFFRLLESHVSWATAPLLILGASFIPLLFNPDSFAANQLPLVASRIQQIAMMGILVTMFLSLKALPPKPKRYKSHRSFFMVIQWVYLPVVSICYMALSGLYSQTRLMLGLYMGKFDVTEKAVAKDDK